MKKYLLSLLLISVLYSTSFAQIKQIDSLRTALSAAADTNQIAVLFNYTKAFGEQKSGTAAGY